MECPSGASSKHSPGLVHADGERRPSLRFGPSDLGAHSTGRQKGRRYWDAPLPGDPGLDITTGLHEPCKDAPLVVSALRS